MVRQRDRYDLVPGVPGAELVGADLPGRPGLPGAGPRLSQGNDAPRGGKNGSRGLHQVLQSLDREGEGDGASGEAAGL